MPQGDSGLQDSLIKQLQFEIGKKRVRTRAAAAWPPGGVLCFAVCVAVLFYFSVALPGCACCRHSLRTP
jgi:hypothetical protein